MGIGVERVGGKHEIGIYERGLSEAGRSKEKEEQKQQT